MKIKEGKWRFFIAAGLILGMGCSFLSPVFGNELDKMRQQQQQVNRQIETKKQVLDAKNEEISKLLGELERLEKELTVAGQEVASLEQQEILAHQKLQEAEKALRLAEKAVAERSQVMEKRLKEIYQEGPVNYLEVLFGAANITDFLVRMKLLENISKQDLELLESLEAEQQEITKRKAELEVHHNTILSLEKETRAKRAVLASRKQQKGELVTALNSQKKEIERALDEMEAASRQIAAKIRQIQSQQQKSGKQVVSSGSTGWPLVGRASVTSSYGWRIHPLLGTRRFHTGVDLGAGYGTGVVAAGNGKVIYAGWLGSYGNTIVIDHGNGLSTLYAHLSGYAVSEGQEVKRGQGIGKVGSTGLSTGPHLHFEVRKNGEPVNPAGYI